MENLDKRKEQLKKAQSKFKQLKTNVNERELQEIETRVKELNTTKSNYIKTLIKKDIKKELFSLDEIKQMSLIEFIKLRYF